MRDQSKCCCSSGKPVAFTMGKVLRGVFIYTKSPKTFANDVKRQYMHFQTEDIEYDSMETTIDDYWDNGMPCFFELAKLAKHCLCVSHGNAVPKRGFSINKMILQEREMLKEDTIVSLRFGKRGFNAKKCKQTTCQHVFKTSEIMHISIIF